MSSPTCTHAGARPSQAPPAAPAAKPFLADLAAELRRMYANLVFLR